MNDNDISYIANRALITINERLNTVRNSINNTWSSTTSENFDASYQASIDAINEIYDEINTYNATMALLEIYKQNEEKIKELEQLIANEKENPSKPVEYTYTDEYGKLQKGVKYVIDTDKINAWQTQINNLTAENATLKADIISQLETIVPNNLQPKNNHDIAHRGNKFDGEKNNYSIKDNSLQAFINAGKNGFWGAEADVIQDTNGNLVCSHNPVKNGENPPSFEEYLDVCKEYGMTAIIDMKYSRGWSREGEDEYVNQILQTIEEKGMMDSCVIQTNNKNDIVNIRNNSTDARIWYLTDDVKPNNIEFMKETGVECVNTQNKDNASKRVETLTQNGIDSCVWAVNDSGSKEKLINSGATYIMSDLVLGITPYKEGDEDFNDIVN